MSSPTSSPTSSLARLSESKRHRVRLTKSLEAFFTMNPIKYCDNEGGNEASSLSSSSSTSTNRHKSVRFAGDDDRHERNVDDHHQIYYYNRCEIPFLEFSSCNRSLSSIPEESFSLDSTQHCRTEPHEYEHLALPTMTTMTPPRRMADLDQTNHGDGRRSRSR